MTSKNDIEQFLKDFKTKLDVWGLAFRSERAKNSKTLLALEYNIAKVKEVLKELKLEDYSAGPLEDVLYKSLDMWVFGKTIKKQEVYIKITLGLPSVQTICISFHFAEQTMKYPYKKE